MTENHFPSDFDSWQTKPTLLIDTREQTPLSFARLSSEVCGLPTGDYSIKGFENHFAIERKSIADLVACCCGSNRERFEAELVRLRGYEFRRLLICGAQSEITTHRYRSNIQPRAVWASLQCFEIRYSLPFVFAVTPEAAASRLEQWACWFWREQLKALEALK
jgi:DNA excision repair protein ERCC-4